MCYNCGCHIPQDDMGHTQNITDSMLEKVAEERGLSFKDLQKTLADYLAADKHDDQGFEEMIKNASTAFNQTVEEARKETLKLLKTQIT